MGARRGVVRGLRFGAGSAYSAGSRFAAVNSGLREPVPPLCGGKEGSLERAEYSQAFEVGDRGCKQGLQLRFSHSPVASRNRVPYASHYHRRSTCCIPRSWWVC